MLDTATRRRIDTARDILVGKVPDPKSQVEQITIALIYKFMDDMDAETEELGGRRSFFAGDFAPYGWAKLMRSGLGGYETLNLYAEAIARMPENPGIPPLFRDIFKNAFLPYRDPETLRAFLKIIDEFEYDHSERLGDAFEYLLSVLGSQGDAGQFRTPRHIIDFIVAVVDPKKGDTILDPACGTAGYLISAWKHIRAANRDAEGNSTLTPDDEERLARNVKGYDISPDMVRLSLVNMYLHGFSDPHIFEYDTLTSEERWNEFADVILANPPFMSPKGGIRPHNRFSIPATRSEVLFVDYIAEHLTPNGRAGVIVPEGVIFQSGKVYKALRKMLVENHLVTVVSLPAGVFNPYSGVKTSILILDRAAAKASGTIGFFKVTNDGFSLGTQRREVGGSELPALLREIAEYRAHAEDEKWEGCYGRAVAKAEIAADGEYNLSAERYRTSAPHNHNYPLVRLGDEAIFRVEAGGTPKSDAKECWNGDVLWATLVDLPAGDFVTQLHTTQRRITERGLAESAAKVLPPNSVIVSTRATIGRIAINRQPVATNQGFKNIVIRDEGKALPEFVAYMVKQLVPAMKALATGGTFAELSKSCFCDLEIPLPPLDVQREIAAEIEGYRRVIDGARTVVENYRPHIAIDPKWPVEKLGDLAVNLDARRVPITKGDRKPGPFPYYGASGVVDWVEGYLFDEDLLLISEDGANLLARSSPIAFSISGKTWVNNHAHVLRFAEKATQIYVQTYLNSVSIEEYITGSAQPKLTQDALRRISIPIPTNLEAQREIVAEIETDHALVEANRQLIARMEKKIEAAIARVWGAAEPATQSELQAAE